MRRVVYVPVVSVGKISEDLILLFSEQILYLMGWDSIVWMLANEGQWV
jgi:hypothetical protein